MIPNCYDTVVEQRIAVAEVDQSGESLDAVTFGQLRVLDFHHLNTKQVTLVINILQLDQNLITSLATGLI